MGLEQIRNLKANAKLPKQKKVYTIPKKSAKRLERERQENNQGLCVTSPTAELERWFKERRKEMTGVCAHCGGRTTKDSDTYYKFSIAHILPKAYVKSVKTHPLNWIELCHFGKSCHANYDNRMLDLMELNCFDLVIERFIAMYPSISKEERRRIPQVLLDYVENNK